MSFQERWVSLLLGVTLFHLTICWSNCWAHPLSLSPDSSSSVSSVQRQSRLTFALYWLCGMERRREGGNNLVTPPAPETTVCSLEEKPRLRIIVNVNLIICLSVTAFIIGYWAWQAGPDTLIGHVEHGVGKTLWTVVSVPSKHTGKLTLLVNESYAKFHSFVMTIFVTLVIKVFN